jgi:LPXTG-motif cell wall-anchored protein
LGKKSRHFLVTAIGLILILVGAIFVFSVVQAVIPLSLNNGLSDVQVVDLNGNPVAGASVSVVAYYGLPLINGLTDSNGFFSFDPAIAFQGQDSVGVAVITTSFNTYSAQGTWYPEYWADTLVLTLNFAQPTPTPTPYPTYTPTPTGNPTPTPTWHPTTTPFPTPNPTNPIIPIPPTPTNNTLLSILGGLMIGAGIFLIWFRKSF